MIKAKQLIFFILIFLVTYLIFVYPFDVLYYLAFQGNIFGFSSLYFTIIFYLAVIFFFKSLINSGLAFLRSNIPVI